MLKGTVASRAGIISGPARIIHGESQLVEVKKGDILVIPTALPDYTVVLGIVRGVVSEKGAKTSHFANVCREKGIPCIVGVDGAMKIKPGCRIVVDTEDGCVY